MEFVVELLASEKDSKDSKETKESKAKLVNLILKQMSSSFITLSFILDGLEDLASPRAKKTRQALRQLLSRLVSMAEEQAQAALQDINPTNPIPSGANTITNFEYLKNSGPLLFLKSLQKHLLARGAQWLQSYVDEEKKKK